MANVDLHRLSLDQTTEQRKESRDCSFSFFLLTRIGWTQLSSVSNFCRQNMCNITFGTKFQIPKEPIVIRQMLVGVDCFIFLPSFCGFGGMEVILSLPIRLSWWCLPFKLVCRTEWVPTKLSVIWFF